MFSKNKTDWSLLAKYLAGETNEKDTQAITEWLGKNSENRALYKELKSDWKIMDSMNVRFNVDSAWNNLQNRIVANSEPVVDKAAVSNPRFSYRNFRTPLRIAASLLLLAMLGAALVYLSNNMQRVNVVSDLHEKGKVVTLPDGSLVYLNANTRLSYSNRFGKESREVRLAGEAFFEVLPDTNRPFIIYASNARIKVLGTSFNVDARGNSDQVEVFVSTGIVELSEAGNQANSMMLSTGIVGTIDHNVINALKAENENIIAWKTGNMSFHDTRLSDVTSLLNDIFDVHIVIREPGIDTTRINGTYQGDPLDEILKVICTQNHLTVEKSDNMIYLSR